MVRRALETRQAGRELRLLAVRGLLAVLSLGLLWLAFESGLILTGTRAIMKMAVGA